MFLIDSSQSVTADFTAELQFAVQVVDYYCAQIDAGRTVSSCVQSACIVNKGLCAFEYFRDWK